MNDEKHVYKVDQELLWEYEMNMFRNRSALRYLVLIYGLVALIIAVSCLIIYLGMSGETGVLSIIGWIVLGTVGAGVVCFLIWLIVAMSRKGTVIRFAADPQKVWRVLTPGQIKRDRSLGIMNSIFGFLGSGASAMNASRIGTQLETGSYRVCNFDTLNKVRLRPKYDMIQLTDPDKTLNIYASETDYERVRLYITQHAPQNVKFIQ